MSSIIPNLSVDCVVFGFDSKGLNILLTKRELHNDDTGELIFSDYTLQGHHVIVNEDIDNAAKRVLKDKTGLDNIYQEQFHTIGDTARKSNKKDVAWRKSVYPEISRHVISVGYYSLVDSTVVKPDEHHQETSWFPINNLPELGFDHREIVNKALEFLRIKLVHEPVGFELLPEKFTLTQLQTLYESILDKKFDRRNFRKKVAQMKYIISLDEKQKGVAHKPAQVFIFSRDVYDRTKKDKLHFSI